ncbi:DUF1858 domain-containing protein [Allosediminivita pacifica]|uniref:Hybrid cluster-associated redox disulfide protein n=1 Tax=Allosediminivita pacifica TaxID=1267769 RepID=A0A2T6AG03_9RHOB|nr:DUF1858 domain-containing protein [Allosediminivita pacifica]PTX42716.1 hybrid cluster-associated redox disulfide protein [Allosediminivita pacifica]GGB06425.1 hypothetical protein GCM10011324_15590 [Allosediminivita pacifica]
MRRRRQNPCDPDLPLADLFAAWPEAARPFLERGLLCPGCPIAPFHTIIDTCREYGLDEEAFCGEIWNRLSGGEKEAIG